MELAVHHITTLKTGIDLKLDNAARELITELQQQLRKDYRVDSAKLSRRQIGSAILFNGPSLLTGNRLQPFLARNRGGTYTALIWQALFPSTLGKRKKILTGYLRRQRIENGFYFLTKPMLFLGKEPKQKIVMTGMQMQNSIIYCRGSGTTMAL
jgi:hypothetical protein